MAIVDFYIPNVWQAAGDTLADNTKMVPPYDKGILHLMAYLTHTLEGRTFMHSLIPGVDGQTNDTVKVALLAKFATFNVTGPAAEAMVGAHISGFAWVAAPANSAARAEQEAVFKQHTAAVSWFLWEESQGPMFPMLW